MTLQEYRDKSYVFSGKLSANVKQLAFGGIAIVWMFKTSEKGVDTLPQILLISIIFIVLTLVIDSLQYYIGATSWDKFCNEQEKIGKAKDEVVNPPVEYVKRINSLFILKSWSLVFGYGLLIYYLFSRVNFI